MGDLRKSCKKWGYIIAGILLMAVALDWFFEPFSMILGGATGLAIIAQYLWGIPLWATNIAVNIPLFVWAYFVFDKSFVVRSGLCTLLLSFFLFIFERIPPVENDYVTAVIFGGIIYGVGIGMVFRGGATTGGTDLAAGIINKLRPHFGVAFTMMCLDVVIIAFGFTVFGAVRAMYGIIAVVIMTKAVDMVLEGLNFAKAAFIVCDDGKKLGEAVMNGIHRGVTVLPAMGMYTGRDKQVLMVAASRKEIVMLKRITSEVEPGAFMLVTDIREVLGEF